LAGLLLSIIVYHNPEFKNQFEQFPNINPQRPIIDHHHRQNMKMMARLVLVLNLKPPGSPSSWFLLHILVVVTTSKVGHSPVVVIAEIGSSSGAAVTNVVHSLSSLKIPVELSGLQRASCSAVSSSKGLGRKVVVLPCAENILAARVEAITAMLVAIIVIIPGRKAVLWIIPSDVVVARDFVVTCVIPASADCSSVRLLPAQLGRVGHHFAIKI